MEQHQIIISAADEAIARSAAIAIWRLEVVVRRVPWGAPLAELLAQKRFDAIVAEMPGSPSEIGELVRDIRRPQFPSRRLGLIALVNPATADMVMEHLGHGVNRAVQTDRIEEDLEPLLSELLEVAPRYQIGAPATVRPIESNEPEETRCRIENASMSGFLVRCRRELSLGSTIEFRVEASDGAPPIRGRAQICRTTRPGLDTVTGFGARLTDFVGADRGRYERMLLSQAV